MNMDVKQDKPIVAIVVPCYNEEDVLPETAKKLFEKRQQFIDEQLISEKSTILFVDDGSHDSTWEIIEKCHKDNPVAFSGIKLSRNKGHQNAMLCGLLYVKNKVDAAITIDADLQDDIDAMDEMIRQYHAGNEIVFGVRSDRKKDSFIKRTLAQGFYRTISFLGVDTIYNHADFRLMGKHALSALAEYNEVNLFLRGIIPTLLGYKTGKVYFSRKERFAGTRKYTIMKSLKLAIDGITSFSIKPIRLITLLGFIIFLVSIIMIVYFIISYFSGNIITGWASIVCSIWGIGGLILLSIGIVGEYIGNIYIETKRRPRFHMEQILFTGKEYELIT
jgi:glycosyltransferase involved in cell wall biosynthesis